ncbi:MAG: hypothetical protein M3298_06185, partial [Thermoproteota archaeon]|nr:hypothetical protein [Thermoproteota archaeon]
MNSNSHLNGPYAATLLVALFASLFFVGINASSEITRLAYGATLQATGNNNNTMMMTEGSSNDTDDGSIMVMEQNLSKTSVPVTLPLT